MMEVRTQVVKTDKQMEMRPAYRDQQVTLGVEAMAVAVVVVVVGCGSDPSCRECRVLWSLPATRYGTE